jgi:hypothetical protein
VEAPHVVLCGGRGGGGSKRGGDQETYSARGGVRTPFLELWAPHLSRGAPKPSVRVSGGSGFPFGALWVLQDLGDCG